MTSPQMARLDEHLQRLRLNTVRERVEALLQEASEKELSYADFLDGLLSEEVSAKTAKHVTMRTNLARFPFIKGLDSFDFTYQPSVDRKQIQKLSPRGNLPARLLDPVADQVCFRRHAAGVRREHPRDVILAQVRDQQLPAQERRVADHDVRPRPLRFRAVGRQNRIAALDGVERLEDRVARLRESRCAASTGSRRSRPTRGRAQPRRG